MPPVKTEDEFLADLDAALKKSTEEAHWDADRIMAEVVRQFGYDRLSEKFKESMDAFWYS